MDPRGNAKVVVTFWQACVRVERIPPEWEEALLFPLYERGEASLPKGYRPTALLSHMRKLVEKVIDWRFREEYTFSTEPCGFLKRKSVETEILRAYAAHY